MSTEGHPVFVQEEEIDPLLLEAKIPQEVETNQNVEVDSLIEERGERTDIQTTMSTQGDDNIMTNVKRYLLDLLKELVKLKVTGHGTDARMSLKK